VSETSSTGPRRFCLHSRVRLHHCRCRASLSTPGPSPLPRRHHDDGGAAINDYHDYHDHHIVDDIRAAANDVSRDDHDTAAHVLHLAANVHRLADDLIHDIDNGAFNFDDDDVEHDDDGAGGDAR